MAGADRTIGRAIFGDRPAGFKQARAAILR
jgi:hypothetical protein